MASPVSRSYRPAEEWIGLGVVANVQVTGLALPVLLAHSALIEPAACYMSIAGGGLVYGTILVYSGWFGGGSEDEF